MIFRMAGLVFVLLGIGAFYMAGQTHEWGGIAMGVVFAGVGGWLAGRKSST